MSCSYLAGAKTLAQTSLPCLQAQQHHLQSVQPIPNVRRGATRRIELDRTKQRRRFTRSSSLPLCRAVPQAGCAKIQCYIVPLACLSRRAENGMAEQSGELEEERRIAQPQSAGEAIHILLPGGGRWHREHLRVLRQKTNRLTRPPRRLPTKKRAVFVLLVLPLQEVQLDGTHGKQLRVERRGGQRFHYGEGRLRPKKARDEGSVEEHMRVACSERAGGSCAAGGGGMVTYKICGR